MSLSTVIKDRRVHLGIQQKNAAESIGVTVKTLAKWENGETEPKASQVTKLAKLLKLTEKEICTGELNNKSDNPLTFMRMLDAYGSHVNNTDFQIALWDYITDESGFFNQLKTLSGVDYGEND